MPVGSRGARAWKEVFLLPTTQLRLPLRQPCGSCGPRGSKAMPAPASGGCFCWVHLGDFPGSCVFLVCILNLPGGLNSCYLWEGFLPESPFQQRFTWLRPGVFWLLLPSVAFFHLSPSASLHTQASPSWASRAHDLIARVLFCPVRTAWPSCRAL